MRLVNDLKAQNQCLMREIESLKSGKAVEESYSTPESRDKSKVLSIEDKKNGDTVGAGRDYSRKPVEVMGGNVDVSYGQNMRDQGMNPDVANGKINGGEREWIVFRAKAGVGGGQWEEREADGRHPEAAGGNASHATAVDGRCRETRGGGGGSPWFTELPRLGEPTAESGPIDLGDWMIIIEPLLADLSDSSAEWWQLMVTEAKEWYARYLQEG